jgi:hypothetical protein
MKLTKGKLIQLTKKGLVELGYQLFKDTLSGAQGLYGKRIDDNLYLTLGLTIHRYYDFKFTGSFNLSQNTIWSACWGDMPRELYERVPFFLLKEERAKLLGENNYKNEAQDGWWDLENSDSVGKFLEAVKITEGRFLNQLGLTENIRNSSDIKELKRLSKEVLDNVDDFNDHRSIYKFIPMKPIDDIPLTWFKVAENVIKNQRGILNINTVKRLAADAYRQKLIR